MDEIKPDTENKYELGRATEKIEKTEKSLDTLRSQLIELTAEFRNKQDELNSQIYTNGKDEFGDVSLEDLLTTGEATHSTTISKCKIVLKTLTKRESLAIDKLSKNYIKETQDFYNNAVQTDVLSYVIKSYGVKAAPEIKTDEDFLSARASVQNLSDDVVNMIWHVYNRMTRWIKSALEIDLKN
jgi:hypothetical protein